MPELQPRLGSCQHLGHVAHDEGHLGVHASGAQVDALRQSVAADDRPVALRQVAPEEKRARQLHRSRGQPRACVTSLL